MLAMDQATAVLQDFLPRYNARFAAQPEHSEPAYRPADPDLCLPEVLCFKDTRKVGRENTVKNNWRVRQLLPDQERTSLLACASGCWNVATEDSSSGTKAVAGHPGTTAEDGRPVGGCFRLVSGDGTQAYREQRGGPPHRQVPAATPGRPEIGASC